MKKQCRCPRSASMAGQLQNRQDLLTFPMDEEMQARNGRMAGTMQSVSEVVEENTATTEEMAAASGEVAAAVDKRWEMATGTDQDTGEITMAEESQDLIQTESESAGHMHLRAKHIGRLIRQLETEE